MGNDREDKQRIVQYVHWDDGWRAYSITSRKELAFPTKAGLIFRSKDFPWRVQSTLPWHDCLFQVAPRPWCSDWFAPLQDFHEDFSLVSLWGLRSAPGYWLGGKIYTKLTCPRSLRRRQHNSKNLLQTLNILGLPRSDAKYIQIIVWIW